MTSSVRPRACVLVQNDRARYLSRPNAWAVHNATKDLALERQKQAAEEVCRRTFARLYGECDFGCHAECAKTLGVNRKTVQAWMTTGDRHQSIPAWAIFRLQELASKLRCHSRRVPIASGDK